MKFLFFNLSYELTLQTDQNHTKTISTFESQTLEIQRSMNPFITLSISISISNPLFFFYLIKKIDYLTTQGYKSSRSVFYIYIF